LVTTSSVAVSRFEKSVPSAGAPAQTWRSLGLGLDSEHALDEISAIVHEAACPVIALLDVKDPRYVHEAAQRGVFAYVVLDRDDGGELQSALDITLRRFAEFQNLQGAFGRRAIIEQAKGILMERNRIDADAAFALLKSH
jgi:response regulator NasT